MYVLIFDFNELTAKKRDTTTIMNCHTVKYATAFLLILYTSCRQALKKFDSLFNISYTIVALFLKISMALSAQDRVWQIQCMYM
jgi:hypothetical protein